MVDTKILKEFTQDLKVLYVEDDDSLRKGTAELLANFFSTIELAVNGEEGLKKYKNGTFDLVITDIRMPKMDGIAMSVEIKKLNREQNIIVTSAHDETEYLMKLLNEGIDKFILKPFELSRFLEILYAVSRTVTDDKIINAYREELENANIELAEKSRELEAKNRELETKIKKVISEENKTIALVDAAEHERKVTREELGLFSKVFTAVPAKEFVESYPIDLMIQSDKLEGIEDKLDILINRLTEGCTMQDVVMIGQTFVDHGQIIDTIPEFSNIAYALENLGHVILALDEEDISRFVRHKETLYTIADSIIRWRENIFITKIAKNIHYLDNALISDCIQVEALLKNEKIEGEDLELF